MTNRKLAMPDYVSDLICMPLTRMGLEPSKQDDLITCPLTYEDGSELSLAIMCIAKPGWFRETAVLLVSLIQLDETTRAVRVHSRNTVGCPNGRRDLEFTMMISKLVRVMAWSHALRGDMGECVDLPRSMSRVS